MMISHGETKTTQSSTEHPKNTCSLLTLARKILYAFITLLILCIAVDKLKHFTFLVSLSYDSTKNILWLTCLSSIVYTVSIAVDSGSSLWCRLHRWYKLFNLCWPIQFNTQYSEVAFDSWACQISLREPWFLNILTIWTFLIGWEKRTTARVLKVTGENVSNTTTANGILDDIKTP